MTVVRGWSVVRHNGRLYRGVIRNGSGTASVTMDLPGGGSIERHISAIYDLPAWVAEVMFSEAARPVTREAL